MSESLMKSKGSKEEKIKDILCFLPGLFGVLKTCAVKQTNVQLLWPMHASGVTSPKLSYCILKKNLKCILLLFPSSCFSEVDAFWSPGYLLLKGCSQDKGDGC